MSEFDCCVTDLDEKCAECKYADKSAFSTPCVECGFNYSRFEQKEVEKVEKVAIEFAKEEFDKIIEFMDGGEYETVQQAIMAAVENAE